MDKKITIGIDIDGVLRDNLKIMVDLYNNEFGEGLSIEDIKSYKTEISFPKVKEVTGKAPNEWFFQDHSDEIFLNAKPYEYVADDIRKLREIANVVIITYQKSLKNKIQALQWLEKNGIEYDEIAFTKDKSNILCDYLIDDNDYNFNKSKSKVCILIKAPYNEFKTNDEIISATGCNDIARFNNFHEFVEKYTSKSHVDTLYENNLMYFCIGSLISADNLTSVDACNKSIDMLEMFLNDLKFSKIENKETFMLIEFCKEGIEICKNEKIKLQTIN